MDRIRHARRRLGLSQEELAEASGVSAATIVQVELGHRRPQGRTLRKLAATLGVEVADLLEEEASPKAPRRSSLEPSLLNGLEGERRGPNLADAADILLRFAHMLLMQWEAELPARAEADDYEWLAEVAIMWRAFGEANYAVLEALGADGLHDAQDWFARYMDVNTAIHRLNATIRAHSDSDVVPDELLLKTLPTAA